MIELRKKPRKLKSNTPITIAIPKAQKDKIRQLFERSITAIEKDGGTVTDWYNVGFRTKHALEIAKLVYVQDVVDQLEAIMGMVTAKVKYHPELNWHKFDSSELADIKTMHETMCAMEDEVTRRIQLDAILTTDKYMKQFIKKD
jgi:hypothetical protein